MRLSRPIIYVLIFFIGVSSGYIIRGRSASNSDTALDYEGIKDSKSKYTHPLLDVLLTRNASQNVGLKPFKKKVEAFIKEDLNKEWADTVSVYFRDLNNGPWFSIGETGAFYPASLLKVPIMMAVLKQAETDPKVLKEKIHYDNPNVQNFENIISDKMKFGKYYTVDDLLDRMIVHSDNVATFFLENFVDRDILKKTYIHLGLFDPYIGAGYQGAMFAASTDYKISVEEYASFFRVLYNASYLDRGMSEKALGLLARTDFTSGLNDGVPANIEVAHKWGYREYGDNGKIKQLHDCGIIYHPDHPYLLCIMTAGNSFENLDDVIRELSGIVYKEVDSQK